MVFWVVGVGVGEEAWGHIWYKYVFFTSVASFNTSTCMLLQGQIYCIVYPLNAVVALQSIVSLTL